MELEVKFWECPICFSKYEDEEEAIECRYNCYFNEEINPCFEINHVCKYCGKNFGPVDKERAEACEKEHEKKEDQHHNEKSKELLQRCAEHKDQQSLI